MILLHKVSEISFQKKVKLNYNNPKYREKHSNIFKNMWKDPEFRKRKSKQQSELAKKQWNEDDKLRNRVSQASSKNMPEFMKERWKDPEFREKMSKRQHVNSQGRIQYVSKSGKVYYMRSSWEIKFAKYLDAKNIRYTYEGLKIPYSFQNKVYHYYPDFYLPDYNLVLEVKPLCYIQADINQIKKSSVLSEGYDFKFVTQKEFLSLGIELY